MMTRTRLFALLSVSLAFLFLIGCNTPKGLQRRSERIKTQMDKKGILTPHDTIRETDTLVFTKNDTVYQVITKTLEPIVKYETNRVVKWKTRYKTKYKYKTVKVENKAMVDSLRQVLKLERTKERHETKRERRNNLFWWGLGIGLLIGIFRKQIWETIKRISVVR